MTEARAGLSLVACFVMSGWMLGCAHTRDIVPPDPPTDPDTPPSPEEVARWEQASALFAENDEAGVWDGDACHDTLEAFERISAQRDGQSPRAVYMSGLVAQRCGNTDGSRQLFRRALELDASLCEPRVALGLMSMDSGHVRAAREAFEQAVASDGRCAPAYVNLAILQSRRPSERAAAIANLRRALAVRADYLPALNQMARIYLEQSDETPALRDLAQVVCRQAQLIDPSYAPIYNTWALIDVSRGDITAAAAKLERATRLDPDFYEAWMNFGQITLSQRAYQDAARAFSQARRLRSGSYDAAIGLGVAQRGLMRTAEAEQAYRAAVEIDDERAEAWFDLAVLYHEHRDGSVEQLGQALEYYGEFVRRARDEPGLAETMQDTLRWCRDRPARRGRRRAATCQRGRVQVVLETLDLLGEAHERPAWARQ